MILAVCIAFAVTSCGEKTEQSEGTGKREGTTEVNKSTEGKQETESTGQEQLSKEEANTDPSSTESKQNDLGMTPGLPADFPKDVPTPKNAKTIGSINSTEGTVVTFESTDLVPAIVDFYKAEMKNNGYELAEGAETVVSDKGGIVNWKKDSKEVGLMLGYDKDKEITSLVITYK